MPLPISLDQFNSEIDVQLEINRQAQANARQAFQLAAQNAALQAELSERRRRTGILQDLETQRLDIARQRAGFEERRLGFEEERIDIARKASDLQTAIGEENLQEIIAKRRAREDFERIQRENPQLEGDVQGLFKQLPLDDQLRLADEFSGALRSQQIQKEFEVNQRLREAEEEKIRAETKRLGLSSRIDRQSFIDIGLGILPKDASEELRDALAKNLGGVFDLSKPDELPVPTTVARDFLGARTTGEVSAGRGGPLEKKTPEEEDLEQRNADIEKAKKVEKVEGFNVKDKLDESFDQTGEGNFGVRGIENAFKTGELIGIAAAIKDVRKRFGKKFPGNSFNQRLKSLLEDPLQDMVKHQGYVKDEDGTIGVDTILGFRPLAETRKNALLEILGELGFSVDEIPDRTE